MGSLLAISSSPRRSGNSELLLDSFCQGARNEGHSTELIRLYELCYGCCRACDRCAETGKCAVQDDMQQLYPLVLSSRAMVLATPIYFGSLSGQLKMFIDRFQCWWQAKYTLKKPFVTLDENRGGFLICVGALKNPAYCESATAIAKVFYHNLNYKFAGRLCYRGFDEKGSIKNDPGPLQSAYEAGVNFASEYMA